MNLNSCASIGGFEKQETRREKRGKRLRDSGRKIGIDKRKETP